MAYLRFSSAHADYFAVIFNAGLDKSRYPDVARAAGRAYGVILELSNRLRRPRRLLLNVQSWRGPWFMVSPRSLRMVLFPLLWTKGRDLNTFDRFSINFYGKHQPLIHLGERCITPSSNESPGRILNGSTAGFRFAAGRLRSGCIPPLRRHTRIKR